MAEHDDGTDTGTGAEGDKKKGKGAEKKWLIIGTVATVLLLYLQYRSAKNGSSSGSSSASPSVVAVPTSGGYSSGSGSGGSSGSGSGYGAQNAATLAGMQSSLSLLQAEISGLTTGTGPVTTGSGSGGSSGSSSGSGNGSGSGSSGGSSASGSGGFVSPPLSSPGPTTHSQVPVGYSGAANIQQAIAAHRRGVTVLYRNNTTGKIGVFNPGSGQTPKGATLFVPTNTHTKG